MRRAYSYGGAEVLGKTLHSVILTLTRLVFARRRRRRGFVFVFAFFYDDDDDDSFAERDEMDGIRRLDTSPVRSSHLYAVHFATVTNRSDIIGVPV